jgi:hypothetical protein
MKLNPQYSGLLVIPGVGNILALTIMLETSHIDRFKKVGDYSSYRRKVPTSWISNNKRKRKGNCKNGNNGCLCRETSTSWLRTMRLVQTFGHSMASILFWIC